MLHWQSSIHMVTGRMSVSLCVCVCVCVFERDSSARTVVLFPHTLSLISWIMWQLPKWLEMEDKGNGGGDQWTKASILSHLTPTARPPIYTHTHTHTHTATPTHSHSHTHGPIQQTGVLLFPVGSLHLDEGVGCVCVCVCMCVCVIKAALSNIDSCFHSCTSVKISVCKRSSSG